MAFASGTIVKFIFCVIIDKFSPNIFVLTNVISSIITWIYNVGYKKKADTASNIACLSIGYFIILISCLIYNEIIILNCFKFNENTIINIEERLEKELKLTDDFDDKEYADLGDYYVKSNTKTSISSISSDTNEMRISINNDN